VLSQGHTGKDLPIAYASRVLSKAERNYSSYERELAATVWSYRKFRLYLWGRKFTAITDHQPLVSAHRSDPSAKITRLKLKLAEFEYTIVYKAVKSNTKADGPSIMYLTTEVVGDEVERIAGAPEENLGDKSEVQERDGETTDVEEDQSATQSPQKKEKIIKEMHESATGIILV
jgi:hypothetical protein